MADKAWLATTLGQEVELLTGFPFKSEKYTDEANGISLLRGDNIAQGTLRWDGVKRWSITDTENISNYFLNYGDVVVAMDRPWIEAGLKYGCVSKQDLPCLLVQRVARLRAKEKLDQKFLRYVIASQEFTHHVLSVQIGTAVPHISGSQIKEFQFLRPPLPEQKAIAHILGTLDDKIELNREMNKTLEAMARAIFKSWFVDFDPVRAKMEGRQPVGMDAATAELFPDEFQESALGIIPKGWCVRKLGDLARNISKTFDFSARSQVIFINTGDVLLGSFLHNNRISKEGLPGQAKKSINQNDILISEIRPANGHYAYVDFDSSEYVVSTKFMIIRASDDIEPRFLYRILTLQKTLAELQLIAESRSGTFPQITFDSISYFPIILAPKTIQLAFLRVVNLLEKQIKINDSQSNTLRGIRDTLLPKLLSGEIRVKEAEKIVETQL